MMRRKDKGFTLIELLIVVAIIGIIAAIAIPNLLNAIDRGKQKRTMADLRSVGTAIESYSIDNNFYPVAGDIATLSAELEPLYMRNVPQSDGWNRVIEVVSVTTDYTVCSTGKLGTAACTTTIPTPNPTTSFASAITFSNGQFVVWPEGAQQ